MRRLLSLPRLVFAFAFVFGAAGACSSSSSPATGGVDSGVGELDAALPTPPPAEAGDADAEAAAPLPELLPDCTKDPGAPKATVDPNSNTDPAGGAAAFTLDKALAGYPAGTGQLTAAILTELGTIKCTLDDVHAPVSVANFIGLARGTRPSVDLDGHWRLVPFYDGLTWHRVIPNFVIQGGDPYGDGTGGSGYDLINENQITETLGTLAMAGSSKAPSGSQFYVVVGSGPDAGPAAEYNVFGTCSTDVATAIAAVPTGANDLPTTPVHMMRVEIARCP